MAVINVLDPDSIRKIAAGEVIDNPASIIRELLDNAIDANASHVDVHIEQGGIQSIRITDDGNGMDKEDLSLCWLEHATSKIRFVEDLKHLTTRGFRGEALAAIATVAQLQISSMNNTQGHTLVAESGKLVSLHPATHTKGTTVHVEKLFHDLPARKRFLKSPQAETSRIRKVIWEKAMSVPEVGFRYYTDGKLRKHFPPTNASQRVADVLGIPQHLLYTVQESGVFYSVSAIGASAEKTLTNRSGIKIYANNYGINDFSLVQAVEYAYREIIPGGLFPYAVVFLTIDPTMIDVNIHPAKREVRIRRLEEIRHTIIQMLRSQFSVLPAATNIQEELPTYYNSTEKTISPIRTQQQTVTHRHTPLPAAILWQQNSSIEQKKESEPRYLGQVYGTFLVVLYNDQLYCVDQHACHERILYDRLRDTMPQQQLLLPIIFGVTKDEASSIDAHIEEYRDAVGIQIHKTNDQTYTITAVSEAFLPLIDDLPECIRELKGLHDSFAKDFLALIACKNAVKSRDMLSPTFVQEMLEYVFTLESPHCPHGRPLWVTVSEHELLKRIGRVV